MLRVPVAAGGSRVRAACGKENHGRTEAHAASAGHVSTVPPVHGLGRQQNARSWSGVIVPHGAIRSVVATTVLDIVLVMTAVLGAAWGSVLIHEAGFYLAGLCLGVPASSMRIRLEHPPHVALRQGSQWISPDEQEYASAFAQHNPSVVAAWCFVAGGFLVETVVLLLIASMFQGFGTFSLIAVGVSTTLVLMYLVSDVALSRRDARPYGDMAAMWTIAAVPTVVALVAVLLLRTGAILLLI